MRLTGRRKPVPKDWRDQHHDLYVTTHIGGGGWGGWARTYRSRGYCSCGVQWPAANTNADNLQAPEVRELWMDHVERVYYEDGPGAPTSSVLTSGSTKEDA